MKYKKIEIFITCDKIQSSYTYFYDTFLGHNSLDVISSFDRRGIQDIDGKKYEVYICDVISASGKSIPVGSLRWFEDESCFVIPIKGNPKIGLILYSFTGLSNNAKQTLTESILKITTGNVIENFIISTDTSIKFSKHPLFLLLTEKYVQEKGKDTSAELENYLKAILKDQNSIVYRYAKEGIEIKLSPTNTSKVFTSSFVFDKNIQIISGKEQKGIVDGLYASTKKNWGSKSLPGTGYDEKSLNILTACQYNTLYGGKFPSVVADTDIYGRHLMDIMDGTPSMVSVTDPVSLSELYEKDISQVDIWKMHEAVMSDVYLSTGTGLTTVNKLMSDAGLRRMTSAGMLNLISSVEGRGKVSSDETRILKYFDVMYRMFLQKASKI